MNNLPRCFRKLVVSTALLLGFVLVSRPGYAQHHFHRAATGTLAVSPASYSYGNVVVHKSVTSTFILTNSGSSTLTITGYREDNQDYVPAGLSYPFSLTAGESQTFAINFTPFSIGEADGQLGFVTSSGDYARFSVVGFGVAASFSSAGSLTASPSSVSMGSVQVGSSTQKSLTLTNTGQSTVTLTSAAVKGAGFSVSGLTLPVTLTGGGSVTAEVVFAPTASGAASGTLSVASSAASDPTLTLPLSGTGGASGALAVSPASHSFGTVTTGSTADSTATVTASGAAVTISSATTSNSEFTLSGMSLPMTLAAGKSSTFTVQFTPKASGAASGQIALVSNAASSPAVLSLTGTGASATASSGHSVALSWSEKSSDVDGYNIYRGTQSGGPYSKENSAIDASASYTDDSVQAGQTYYYVVTSVTSDGVESSDSNQATATVPSP
jgi:hypothetical protein